MCKLQIDWDEKVPDDILKQWNKYKELLPQIEKISIPRWTNLNSENKNSLSLLAFCDASEKAYACVIYSRICTPDGIKINQIAAKTRVAPLNKQVSIPRLELLGAELAADLVAKVAIAFDIENIHEGIFCFTGSSVTLAWIKNDVYSRKCFVANRVLKLLEKVNSNRWFHIRIHLNPADIASRGILPDKLSETELWWKAPDFVYEKDFDKKLNYDE